MKKLLSCLLAFGFVLSGCTAATTEPSADKKVLTVYTNSGFVPYEMVDENNNLEGFDIDLMNRIAEITGHELKWENVAFEVIVEGVKSGKADVGISGITVTEDRSKQVDFTDFYLEGEPNVVLVLKDSAMNTTADIKGKMLGVQMGTIQDFTIDDLSSEYGLTMERLTNYTDLVQEVKMKQVDAMVVEESVAKALIKKNPELRYYVLEAGGENKGLGIALPKGSDLKEPFNAALKELKDSGELQKIRDKWFSAE